MRGSRKDILRRLDEVVSGHLDAIRKVAPDARVGFRVSLAKGFKGPHKRNALFNADSFDVDAFMVSDKLPNIMRGGGFRRGPNAIRDIQRAIDAELRSFPEFAGLRGGRDRFEFRIFRSDEIARKARGGDVQVFFGEK